jgi:hypothetical protein
MIYINPVSDRPAGSGGRPDPRVSPTMPPKVFAMSVRVKTVVPG